MKRKFNGPRLLLIARRSLRTNQLVSQSELDSAEAAWKQAVANADNIRATIEKKTIRAPFAGRLGIRQVNLGQYLDAGKPIVSLQSLTPIYADFSLPQQELGNSNRACACASRPTPIRTVALKARCPPSIPTSTRPRAAWRLQATFENPDQSLRPGMFARVEVLLPEEQSVLVIPATSVLSAPYGDSVYVIESKPGKDRREARAWRCGSSSSAPADSARRFRQRGIGPQAGRTHCQRRRLQAAQWHGRDREQ